MLITTYYNTQVQQHPQHVAQQLQHHKPIEESLNTPLTEMADLGFQRIQITGNLNLKPGHRPPLLSTCK